MRLAFAVVSGGAGPHCLPLASGTLSLAVCPEAYKGMRNTVAWGKPSTRHGFGVEGVSQGWELGLGVYRAPDSQLSVCPWPKLSLLGFGFSLFTDRCFLYL